MADKKIHEFPLKNNLTDADLHVVGDPTTGGLSKIPHGTLKTYVQGYYPNVEALKSVRPVDGTMAVTGGYYLPNDGGGATYIYNSSSTATDNGGKVHLPTVGSGAGRWILANLGDVNLRQFGAKGDGVTDDTVALNAAIAYARSFTGAIGNNRRPVRMGVGDYLVSSQIVLPNESFLIGEGRSFTRIYAASGFPVDTAVIKIGSSASNYDHTNGFRGLSVSCNNNADIGVEIYNCNENGGLYDFEIKHFRKKGVFINGSRAINFAIRDAHIATAYSSIDDPIGVHVSNTNHPLNLQRLTVITGKQGGGIPPQAIGISCTAGGFAITTVSDCHFESCLYGVSATNGQVHAHNLDGTSNVGFLVNMEGAALGFAEHLLANSNSGGKAIRDASGPFAGSPISFGDFRFNRRYAFGRAKGLGAIYTKRTTISTDGSGIVLVPHDMPSAPNTVAVSLLNPDNASMIYPKVRAITATDIKIQLYDITTSAFSVNASGLLISLTMEM